LTEAHALLVQCRILGINFSSRFKAFQRKQILL
jgi:hypothetical protein